MNHFELPIVKSGIGFDVHPFAPGRDLILGGIKIPHDQGLAGHSDADVLIHAICDALLGAASLRDIGYHFPNTDPKYKGISSLLLLEQCVQMLLQEKYVINHIDTTVIAEKPHLSPYIEPMIQTLKKHLPDNTSVNIKATTAEKLGALGRQEGIAALAIATIEKKA